MKGEKGNGIGRCPHAAAWGAGFLIFLGVGARADMTPAPMVLRAPELTGAGARGRTIPAPQELTAVARAGFNLLSWQPVRIRDGIAGYHIYRSMTPGGPYTLLSDAVCAPECVFMDRQVVNGTWYHYVVRAHDGGGREGPSSSQGSARADTAPPGARIHSLRDQEHFSGEGPTEVVGSAVDAVSGVVAVRLGVMRDDTKQWWNGKGWEVSDRPVYLPVTLAGGGINKTWRFNAEKVDWREAMSYTVAVMVRDSAGFEQAPANSARIYVDTPAELTASVAAAPAAVTVGQPVNVSVLIANTGGSEAIDVRPGLPEADGTAVLVPATAPAVGGVDRLAPGEFATFSWSFSTTAAGRVSFRAGCEGSNALTGVPAKTSPGVSNEVLIRRAARLEVSVTPSPSNVREGTSFEVRMRIRNVGQSEAEVSSVSLEAAEPSLVSRLKGPNPSPPFLLKGGETRDLIWKASAGDAGVVAFTGAALGHDTVSGVPADSGPITSLPVGVASAPAAIQLAVSKGSAVVGSEIEVTAVVRDSGGTPVPGMKVSFGVLAGRGTLVAPAVLTDEHGEATTVLRLADQAGMATVEGRLGTLLASISVESILPGGAEQVLSRNFFDPSKGETADVRIYQPRMGRVRVRIFGLNGNLVATLADTAAAAGWATYTWDGTNGDGKTVQNGVYFFSIEAGGNMTSRRIIVLRR